MASTTETGLAKNIANFEELIGYCKGYGASYNPSKAAITIASLNALLANATAAMASVKTAKAAYDIAQNAREEAYAPLRKLSTKVINALAATDASKLTVSDAKSANLKVQGRRANNKAAAKPAAAGETGKSTRVSVSQQSFDNVVDNFAKLIEVLAAEPHYKPNEAELQVATLTSHLTELKALNSALTTATASLSNARISRDEVLFGKDTGLYDTAMAVKQYVKSVFGPSGREFKQISGIRFGTRK